MLDDAAHKRLDAEVWEAQHATKPGDSRRHADRAVALATKIGYLKRAACCQWCGAMKRIDGFAPDSREPMDVIWACRDCQYALAAMYLPAPTTRSWRDKFPAIAARMRQRDA